MNKKNQVLLSFLLFSSLVNFSVPPLPSFGYQAFGALDANETSVLGKQTISDGLYSNEENEMNKED